MGATNMIPVAFDLEIAKEVEGNDWSVFRPLGITCAALHFGRGVSVVDHGALGPGGSKMTAWQVQAFIARMYASRRRWTIVTWNGLGFDFDILAEEACNPTYAAMCSNLALNHIDIGFQMLCERGFMVALNVAAKGLGLHGKTEGMSGDKAPTMWTQGEEQQKKVLEYVEQDVITTLQVYERLVETGKLSWITKAGTPAKYPWEPEIRNGRLLTASECLNLPLPDTSWMDEPWPREKFTRWTTQ